MKELVVKNTKTGKKYSITKNPPAKVINIRRSASKPSGRRSA